MLSGLDQNLVQDKHGLTTNFKVVISGIRDMRFKSCDGIESEISVRQVYGGGNFTAPKTARDVQRVNKITFSRGILDSDMPVKKEENIFQWYLDVCDSSKPLKKRSLSIQILSNTNSKISEWLVHNAWPCRWVGPLLHTDMNNFTVEYVTFAHEGIEAQ